MSPVGSLSIMTRNEAPLIAERKLEIGLIVSPWHYLIKMNKDVPVFLFVTLFNILLQLCCESIIHGNPFLTGI